MLPNLQGDKGVGSPSSTQRQAQGWPLPLGLDQRTEDFRDWLRSLLWELSHVLAQVSCVALSGPTQASAPDLQLSGLRGCV